MKVAGQLRMGGMGGIAGVDLGVALDLARAIGYDVRAMAELLPAAERGLVRALNRKPDDEGLGNAEQG